MSNKLPDLTFSEFMLWLLGLRKRLRIKGDSMRPLLVPGDEVLVDPRAYKNKLPQVNDLIVAVHPHTSQLTIIKRLAWITEQGELFLLGDNPEYSTDSRSYGTFELETIKGKVTSKFRVDL